MPAEDVARWLARPAARPIPSDVEFARAVAEGLPPEVADALLASGTLEPEELYRLVVPRRTLAHRRQHGQRLSPEESDRLTRVARLVAFAEETLGDAEKARRWLHRPNRALAGDFPIALLASEHGARAVEAVLGRVAYGVFS
jgi:putative toxin-antitoxin system antitoxin component (TIGR02293 family)